MFCSWQTATAYPWQHEDGRCSHLNFPRIFLPLSGVSVLWVGPAESTGLVGGSASALLSDASGATMCKTEQMSLNACTRTGMRLKFTQLVKARWYILIPIGTLHKARIAQHCCSKEGLNVSQSTEGTNLMSKQTFKELKTKELNLTTESDRTVLYSEQNPGKKLLTSTRSPNCLLN